VAGDNAPGLHPADLVWRVRLFMVSDTELTVEQPSAAGRAVSIEPGVPLIAVMSVGQNRWMFHTRVLSGSGAAPGRPATLRLATPERVERCARREFLRISTAELHLPGVECWPLLEPASVVAAEAANRDRIRQLRESPARLADDLPDDLLPEVGPKFAASLMNIGGGGVGLLVRRDDAQAAGRSRLLWTRVNLMPHIAAPLAMTAKVVHTHIDSAQNLYLGAAFEFGFNQSHREFVVDQITAYVNRVQALRRAA